MLVGLIRWVDTLKCEVAIRINESTVVLNYTYFFRNLTPNEFSIPSDHIKEWAESLYEGQEVDIIVKNESIVFACEK